MSVLFRLEGHHSNTDEVTPFTAETMELGRAESGQDISDKRPDPSQLEFILMKNTEAYELYVKDLARHKWNPPYATKILRAEVHPAMSDIVAQLKKFAEVNWSAIVNPASDSESPKQLVERLRAIMGEGDTEPDIWPLQSVAEIPGGNPTQLIDKAVLALDSKGVLWSSDQGEDEGGVVERDILSICGACCRKHPRIWCILNGFCP